MFSAEMKDVTVTQILEQSRNKNSSGSGSMRRNSPIDNELRYELTEERCRLEASITGEQRL